MINKNKYIILLWIINIINYQTQETSVTSPLLNETSVTSPLQNETIENSPVKDETSQLLNKTSPLNHQIILKENKPSNIESMTLDNNTQPIKYRTFKVIMVYILAIIGYIIHISYWLKVYLSYISDYVKYSIRQHLPRQSYLPFEDVNVMFITTIFITIGLIVLIYGWVTKRYIHNLIIQSWKYWILYIITLIIISLLPHVFQQIPNKIYHYHLSLPIE